MWACQRWCHVCCFHNFQKRFNPPSKNEKNVHKAAVLLFILFLWRFSWKLHYSVNVLLYKVTQMIVERWVISLPTLVLFCSDHLSRHWWIQLMYRLNEWRVFNAVPSHRFRLILICVCSENHNISHVQSDNPVRQNQSFSVAAHVFANFTLFFKKMKTWPLCKLLLHCCVTLHVFLFEG